jgi:hypothetical protein
LTIHNIRSPIGWAITKVIKNYTPLPNVSSVVSNCHTGLKQWILTAMEWNIMKWYPKF